MDCLKSGRHSPRTSARAAPPKPRREEAEQVDEVEFFSAPGEGREAVRSRGGCSACARRCGIRPHGGRSALAARLRAAPRERLSSRRRARLVRARHRRAGCGGTRAAGVAGLRGRTSVGAALCRVPVARPAAGAWRHVPAGGAAADEDDTWEAWRRRGDAADADDDETRRAAGAGPDEAAPQKQGTRPATYDGGAHPRRVAPHTVALGAFAGRSGSGRRRRSMAATSPRVRRRSFDRRGEEAREDEESPAIGSRSIAISSSSISESVRAADHRAARRVAGAGVWRDWLARLEELAPDVLKRPQRVLAVLADLRALGASDRSISSRFAACSASG